MVLDTPDAPVNAQRRIAHADASLVGAARRAAAEMGARIPFVDARVGRDALIATELASNLHKHARDGEILLRALGTDGLSGLEVLAIDRGPGIRNLQDAMRDGISSAGSPGTGLGAIRRMSDIHDIDTRVDRGTVALARLFADPSTHGIAPVAIGAVCQPRHDEIHCGDAWAVAVNERGCRMIVADGLGHGPLAAVAAQAAIAVFRAEARAAPAEILGVAHDALRATRGAAVFVVDIDVMRSEVRYAGVGNIAAVIMSRGALKSLISHNGTVGHEMRKVQQLSRPWSDDALLVVHSDGLATRWDLASYPGLASRHPSIVAGTLYRDFRRPRDDVTVVAVANQASRWATSS